MIPVLLSETKPLSELLTDKTCLARLRDCISCVVDEERNGPYTCTFRLPITFPGANFIHTEGIVRVKPNDVDDKQLFRIKKITKSIDGMMLEVYCEHITYDLNKTSVLPFTATGETAAMAGIKSHMSGGADFSITGDVVGSTTDTAKFTVSVPQSARSLFAGQSGSLLDVYGGEWYFNNLTCKLTKRGQDRGVTIRYGKNLTSLQQEENIANMYSKVVPYVTRQDKDPVIGTTISLNDSKPEKYLNLDLTSEFENTDDVTADQVNSHAQSYVKRNDLASPSVSLEVEFADLTAEERTTLSQVALCDTVHVYFPSLGVTASAKCVSYEYDVLNERYTKIELGNAHSDMASTMVQNVSETAKTIDTTKSFLEQAIEKASELLKGGTSGHMVIGTNANGEANELFFMDTDNKATAKNVFRLNMNGWGLSTTGIDGPYTTACTIDGNFNASIINSGEINGLLIKGGTIAAGALDDDLSGKL